VRQGFGHVQVKIGEVQYSKAVEGCRQSGDADFVFDNLQRQRIALAAPVHEPEPQQQPDQAVDGIPVLDVKEAAAASEHALVVLALDAQPQPGVIGADAFLQGRHECCFG
jgi:hypothetical protein